MRRLILCGVACGIVASGCQTVDAKPYNPQSNTPIERTVENCKKAITEISVPARNVDQRVKECIGG